MTEGRLRFTAFTAFAAFAAVFVLAAAASGHLAAQTDGRLDGTWGRFDEGIGSQVDFTFGNGIVETRLDDAVVSRGTYTSGGGILTMTITHVHGDLFEGLLEPRMYSVEELLNETMMGMFLSEEMLTYENAYSISGNTLSMTAEGETGSYTRK